MLFSTSALITAVLAGTALASPAPSRVKREAPNKVVRELVPRATSTNFENLPWQLKNIFIFQSASNGTTNSTNSTNPSTVNFDISDANPELEFNVHCSRTVQPGENLYDGQYRQCGPADLSLAWYLDSGKNIYIQRGWTDPNIGPPPENFVVCFGNWGLNPHPFEVRVPKFTGTLLGTNYTQGCLEVYCTQAVA